MSYVVQIASEKIPAGNHLEVWELFDHWFTDAVADEVEAVDSNNAYRALERMPGIAVKRDADGSTRLVVEDKEEFFKKRHKQFLKEVEELRQISLKDFSSGGSMQMFRLGQLYEYDKGIYVIYGDRAMDTLDELVRYSKNGQEYWLGGALYYK